MNTVTGYLEQHFTLFFGLLTTGIVALGSFWLYVFAKLGGKPGLEQWNIRLEESARQASIHKLVSGIQGIQRPSTKKMSAHHDSIIAGLDQLNRSQVHFTRRNRIIQQAHKLSFGAFLFMISAKVFHEADVQGHRLCSLMALGSICCFSLILYQWVPLIYKAYETGVFPANDRP